MSRRFVNELQAQENVDQVFLATEKQLRPNRNGNLYLQVDLSDKTGSINARLWNANESLYRSFENGDYVRVTGTTQLFQGALQLIATKIERVPPEAVDPSDFVPVSEADVEKLSVRLAELLRSLGNHHLANLAECFLMDDALMRKLAEAPAGIRHHHAYRGGLLEHIVNLMEVVKLIAPRYPQIDADLLLFGAFLHDLGKVDELSYSREFAYSDSGQLLGHLVIGIEMLSEKIREAEKLSGEEFPAELAVRLKHMIVAHHGIQEFGSPKVPMTLEAVALACLDNLDAKIAAFDRQIREDANLDSAWTSYNNLLGCKVFKGRGHYDG
ncbi:MAG: HD domain-containing protein [Planctomycetota bacterium]|nr:MAG: HD domain-containing protein [Planctomycetota bacterium]